MVDMEAVASGQLQVRTSQTSELSASPASHGDISGSVASWSIWEEKSQQVPTCPNTIWYPSPAVSLAEPLDEAHEWFSLLVTSPKGRPTDPGAWRRDSDAIFANENMFGSEALPPPKKHVV